MTRLVLAAVLALLPLAARAQTEQQTLVDRATLAVQEMLGENPQSDARSLMRRAKGVMVCPRVFKAGFILGGQGGGCIMAGGVAARRGGAGLLGLWGGGHGLFDGRPAHRGPFLAR